jgi:hypothetical protein
MNCCDGENSKWWKIPCGCSFEVNYHISTTLLNPTGISWQQLKQLTALANVGKYVLEVSSVANVPYTSVHWQDPMLNCSYQIIFNFNQNFQTVLNLTQAKTLAILMELFTYCWITGQGNHYLIQIDVHIQCKWILEEIWYIWWRVLHKSIDIIIQSCASAVNQHFYHKMTK